MKLTVLCATLLAVLATNALVKAEEKQAQKADPIPAVVQHYDWKQWLSKTGRKSSVATSKSSSAAGSKGKGNGFDWQQFLSNSYAKPPSSIQEQYSFSPFDWNKFVSFNGQAQDVARFYDWKQWLSKSGSDVSKEDGHDWDKWLTYIPDDVQFYDWKQWLSKSSGKAKSARTKRPSQNSLSRSTRKKSRKSASTGTAGKYDWRQWLSKSSSGGAGGGQSGKVSSGGYDWKNWLSKSATGGSGKGGYDWKKWLSKSGSTGTSGSVSGGVQGSSGGQYDWKQWLSKSVGSGTGGSGYDWKQWISKSGGGQSSSGIDVASSLGNDFTSPPPTSSNSASGNVGGYDWKQWLSKSGSASGNDGYDWKQWLSNSFGEIPSGLEESYSFSPFDWNKYISANEA